MQNMFNSVEEVVAKLADREFAAPYVVKVNKGSAASPRFLDIIEWHTAVRMLDAVFTPFGWSAEIVGSVSNYETGLYIVDLTLTGRAINTDESGNQSVVELRRPGRGLGLVPRSVLGGGGADAEHDRQAHGAKSDAITNATKALGDGFGLYLYKKTAGGQSVAASNGGATATARPVAQAAAPAGGTTVGQGPRPSVNQQAKLTREGYPPEFVATLDFGDWKDIVNALMNKDEDGNWAPLTPAIAPPGAQAQRGSTMTAKTPGSVATKEPDAIPF